MITRPASLRKGCPRRRDSAQRHSEAVAEVAIRGLVPVAARRPRVADVVVVPAPAAQGTGIPLRRSRRIRDPSRGIIAIPVLALLPHVSVHVIQSPRVRLLLSDRMRLIVRVLTIPRLVAQLLLVVPETPPSFLPGPAGVLPLCFRRQPRLPAKYGTCLLPHNGSWMLQFAPPMGMESRAMTRSKRTFANVL